MKSKSGPFTLIHKIEQYTIVRTVRNGLINMIPVLTIGAFALILKTFPIEAYQKAITNFAGGFFPQLFDFVYSATFGMLAVYSTYFISRAYMKLKADPETLNAGAVVASLLSFFILAGTHLSSFGTDRTGPKSMFLAIIAGLGASSMYLALDRFFRKRRRTVLSSGADREFNRMLATIFPISIVAVCVALFNSFIIRVFNVDSFHTLLVQAFNSLFSHGTNYFVKGLFFVLFSSVLWFFGIHGSDTLEGVMQTFFAPGLAQNQAAISAGNAPTEILTKEFFDCFVLMGGCGSAICLLIAILIFSRNKARRGLGLTATFPMLFNINEIMVFGLPIIFNPIMLIPFLAVPLVCFTVSYLAIYLGIVPMITGAVEWTTPVLLGGFRATGSLAGAFLQLFNIIVGALIYMPFVRLLDKKSEDDIKQNFDGFIEYFKKNENNLSKVRITDLDNMYGDFAKALCAELRVGLENNVILFYQPQFDFKGKCVGVEALLRWRHPVHGILYPPLVVKLADEGGFLPELEEAVLLKTMEDRPKVLEQFGPDVKISLNVTGTTIVTPRFLQFCRQQNEKDQFLGKNICIEVTEQSALSFNDDTRAAMTTLRGMGILLAIDDFSMGQTSLHYLKDNMFDIIKLDGALVRGLFTNSNCREIIISIVRLADSLDLLVFAEYVETEEQRDILHEIGCNFYQGYLYSPAVPLSDPENQKDA